MPKRPGPFGKTTLHMAAEGEKTGQTPKKEKMYETERQDQAVLDPGCP